MKQHVSFSSELLSARKCYCLTSAAAVMEPLGGHDAHRDAGLVEGAPQGAGSGVAQALRRQDVRSHGSGAAARRAALSSLRQGDPEHLTATASPLVSP